MSKDAAVLIIAGSDSSGGAGIQADIEVLKAFGIKTKSAITALTAQDNSSVLSIHPTPSDVLSQQLSAAYDKNINVVKIGMVATLTNVKTIVWFLKRIKLKHVVIDPVFYSSSGTPLLETKALSFFRQQLLPLGTIITPNLREAGVLAGMKVASLSTMKKAAEVIHLDIAKIRGGYDKPLVVLVKGGHLEGDAVDVYFDGNEYLSFTAKRIKGVSPRGTGCRCSTAIAAGLALGDDICPAIAQAKKYVKSYISGR